ncbi:hypothetical protein J113_20030 [Mycobacterium tuberculosis CAS/NITR204]|uniref:Peptidase M23 domain-containing protein n=1 Tax=Mycobacterium tuberculosis CAS/NITR204 TaxID=1310114 RepID=R4MHC9_MYCTX|nr:hypothetical protein J113_20030 [Mycobacterium tuberculosis CAS/NITR204]
MPTTPGWAGVGADFRQFDAASPNWNPGHRGVDLAGRPGQPVYAAGSATVVFAAARGTAGGFTGPPGWATHQLRAGSRPGPGRSPDRPSIGALAAGHPGCQAAACLHWGAMWGPASGANYVDPLGLLKSTPIRLKPLSSEGRTLHYRQAEPVFVNEAAAGALAGAGHRKSPKQGVFRGAAQGGDIVARQPPWPLGLHPRRGRPNRVAPTMNQPSSPSPKRPIPIRQCFLGLVPSTSTAGASEPRQQHRRLPHLGSPAGRRRWLDPSCQAPRIPSHRRRPGCPGSLAGRAKPRIAVALRRSS